MVMGKIAGRVWIPSASVGLTAPAGDFELEKAGAILYCVVRWGMNTAQSCGDDARSYRNLMAPLARDWEKLAPEFLQPMLHLPRYPLALGRFGIHAICPATWLTKALFKNESTRALFAGIAAHSFLPLESPVSSAFGLVLGSAGHAVGWPIPRGGSQSISNALAKSFIRLAGEIEIDRRIQNLEQLPKSRVTLFDTTVWQLARITGERLPARYRQRLENFRHAPGIFKIDYALSSPIPWKVEGCRRAGTIHLGGTIEEIANTERDVARGK